MNAKTKPSFEHRHFKTIAAIIATAPVALSDRDHLAQWFARELAATNPRFDRDRFVAAAMGAPFNRRDRVAKLQVAIKGINAALNQNATFPADVEYARKIAREAMED